MFRTESYQTAQIGKWNTGIDSGRGRDWDDQVVGNRPRVPENAGSYFYDPLLVTNNGEPTHEKTYRTDHCINLAIDYLKGANRVEDKLKFDSSSRLSVVP